MLNQTKGKLIVFSAASGAGKTTIVKEILKEFPQIIFSISATTRPRRENERDGIEYFFLTEADFRKMIENDEFIEWEEFYDYYYGTQKSFINGNIDAGKPVLLELDVKGALTIKRLYPYAHLIYISPPSFEELVKRLKQRNTESESDFMKRIDRAKMELSLKDQFEYIIENKDLNTAITEAKSLVKKILKEN
ncbi:MAG: guanylate kinase [Ignavibacteriaceae bacterium]|nr:guanylate kinase [Ignavibacteriaceae bacterium]